jgi:hypothetical protein
METTKNYFRPVLRRRDTLIAVALILMPVAFLLLSVYIAGRTIQALEEVFLVIIGKKEN